MSQTLFGHLALRFASSPENLATEALSFILSRSPVSNAAFVRYLAQTGAALPATLKFETQAGDEDAAIPDLVGLDDEGRAVVIGEAKFWAGLTEHQPVTYLRRVPSAGGGLLCFLAPAQRFATLWPELGRRCREAGFDVQPTTSIAKELLCASVGTQQRLVLASWRSVLHVLRDALETEGDTAAASDVLQLQGLCERMDTQAFLPLRSEELTANVGRRLIHYRQLIDEVTNIMVARGIASTKKLRATASQGRDGRYMIIDQHGYFLHVNASYWSERRATPIWLRIRSVISPRIWGYPVAAKRKLARWELEDPGCLFDDEQALCVPIYLPTAVEEDGVVDAMLSQMLSISAQLAQP